uniref:Uncharacterized protein n=1 Tax=Oryza rufipogon TaxID=4529 RepID=A0A0E0R8E1_ORYRU
MRLQELPLLKHLCTDMEGAPCAQEDLNQAVQVSGERAWWEKLIWDDDSSLTHRSYYNCKFPLPFASFNERATVTSYLR